MGLRGERREPGFSMLKEEVIDKQRGNARMIHVVLDFSQGHLYKLMFGLIQIQMYRFSNTDVRMRGLLYTYIFPSPVLLRELEAMTPQWQ